MTWTRLGGEASERRALVILTTLSALVSALLLALTIAPPTVRISLAPGDTHPLRGHAFAFTLPPSPWAPWLVLRGDDHGVVRSRLVLLEDGRPLPSPHARQRLVESEGGGRYLHLRASELYFSTSDGTDPRSNGRRYEVTAPAVPPAALTGTLLAILFVSGSMLWAGRSGPALQPGPWVIASGACLIATVWLAATWYGAPLVVDTGDGGNVASIAAGWMHRDRFAEDAVFATSATSTVYLAAIVPATIGMAALIGDIGQGYLVLVWPMLVIQLLGFHRLGLRLFGHHGAALALALLSVPPVYAFPGELWGFLSMPLTRSMYGALFPWLVILLLRRDLSGWQPFWLMAACGLGIYVHPPSAPSVALAFWLAMLLARPAGIAPGTHLLRMIGAGAVFLAFALPLALVYIASFPSGAESGAGQARSLAADALAARAGPQYYDAGKALRRFIVGGGNPHGSWGWRWILWGVGIAAFWRVAKGWPDAAEDCRRLRWLMLGLLVASAGLAALDQAIAAALGRRPVQIDLIRNLRFLIPLMLIGAVWFIVQEARRAPPGWRARGWRAALPLLCIVWWWTYPTPPVTLLKTALTGETSLRTLEQPHDRALLARLAAMPAHKRVLPLPLPRSESATELVGLAIRYGSLQPVVFLQKDINLLAYSSSPSIPGWLRTEAALQRAQDATDADAAAAQLRQVLAERQVDLVVLHADEAPRPMIEALGQLTRETARDGPWRLLEVLPQDR